MMIRKNKCQAYQQIYDRWFVLRDQISMNRENYNKRQLDEFKLIQNKINTIMESQKQKRQMIVGIIDKSSQRISYTNDQIQKLKHIRQEHLQQKQELVLQQVNNFEKNSIKFRANNKKKAQKCFIDLNQQLTINQTSLTDDLINQNNQFQSSRDNLLSKFHSAKNKYQQSLNELTLIINQQIQQINHFIYQHKQNILKQQSFIKSQISTLYKQLNHLTTRQIDAGQVTYDCLLALLDQCITQSHKRNLKL